MILAQHRACTVALRKLLLVDNGSQSLSLTTMPSFKTIGEQLECFLELRINNDN